MLTKGWKEQRHLPGPFPPPPLHAPSPRCACRRGNATLCAPHLPTSVLPSSLDCGCSKNAAPYTSYVLIIVGAVGVALGALLACPGLVKGCLPLLLVTLLLAWAAVAASTALLQVGADG